MPCPVKQALPLLVRTMMMSTMARACCTIHDNPCVHVHVSMVNDEVNSDERSVKPPVHFNVDSGASVHCINDSQLFEAVYEDHPPVRITVANKQVLIAKAVGSVRLRLRNQQGEIVELVIHNVVYHPDFHENLLSVRRLWKDNRLKTSFGAVNRFKCVNTLDKFTFGFAGTGYYSHTVSAAKVELTDELLHSRFGHCSERRLNKLITRCVNFPNPTNGKRIKHDPRDCDACQSGGMKRHPFPKRAPGEFTYFGQRLSSDLCKFPKSIEGYEYLLCVVDAYSNWLVTVPLKSKSSVDVRDAIETFLKRYADYLPHDDRPITWHTDNGGEFLSSDISEFCDEFCVKRSFSVPFAPPMNAHAERMWGLILRTTRIFLVQSSVHESFWVYAAKQATLIHNYLPSSKLPGEISPYQALTGKLPDVGKIRTWGCLVWYFVPEKDRTSKLSPRAVPAVHLGLDDSRNGYFVYVPSLNRITTATHVSFSEKRFLVFTDDGIARMPRHIKPLRDTEFQYREDRDRKTSKKQVNPDLAPDPDPIGSDDGSQDSGSGSGSDHDHDSDDERPTRAEQTEKGKNPPRQTRNPNPISDQPHRGSVVNLITEDVSEQLLSISPDALLGDITIPGSYEEAKKGRWWSRWLEAMKTEFESLISLGTWEYVDQSNVPKGRQITKSKWVYDLKLKRDGTIERFKARFVVRGFSQVKGQDYTESYSATLRATSFRLLMALAAGEKLKCEHFDVKNAFTQSSIDNEIYVQPPKGFETKGKDDMPQVLKLVKSLYGTKQASRLWQMKLRDHLVNHMGFTCSLTDPCLFVKRDDKGGVMILGVYVDDIILAHKNSDLDWFIREFTGPNGFDAKHLGKLSWFLGMACDQHEDCSVSISQELYIAKLLDRFCPAKKATLQKRAMPCASPLSFQKLRPAANDLEREKASRLPYLQLIGSLLYLSCMTRPDISYHMSILCSFMHDPTVEAYDAAIHLLQYIACTTNSQITFTGSTAPFPGLPNKVHGQVSKNHGFVAYSDASWHKPNKLGFNMFGFVVYFYGGPISFSAKRLKVVSLSSAEAEYAAASYTCKEIMFIRNVCNDLGVQLDGPTILAVDNQAAIKIVENMGVTGRNKHFEDSLHYIRHLYDHRVIKPIFVTTRNQRADGFTKPLEKSTFTSWRTSLLHFVE